MPPVRVALISDTHGRHERLALPEADLLVHGGDVTWHGKQAELVRFLDWFASRREAPAKVFIAGNHDFCCEEDPGAVRRLAAERGVVYLDDDAASVAGLRLWGSPVTPFFRDMAFNRSRGEGIRAHWAKVPAGLDVLVTHTPPAGLGDRTWFGMRVGCADLLARVREVRPRVHVYGHIHEGRGEYALEGVPTRFVNASSTPTIPVWTKAAIVLEVEPCAR